MLTSLDFLSTGQPWPPECECERMEMYHHNKELFEGEHAEVYREDLKRIERVIGNFDEVISYPVIINFHKLMTLKTADLLLGEPPQISAGDTGSKEQTSVETIEKNSDLLNTMYMSAIDISRYGDGILNIRSAGEHGIIDITQPHYWYPVVSPDNVKEITNHVLAWCYETGNGDKTNRYLKARVHYKGYYDEKVYHLDGSTIGTLMTSQRVQTKLDDFAIVPISNVSTSDRITGIDDYTDIDSIVSELIVRVSQVSRILDKHAAPSMQGPMTALEQDPETGQWRLKTGTYFPRDSSDDPEVAYITWDAQLTANFTQIEKLVNFLYTVSEMGSAVFGDLSNSTGQVPSGSALKRLMISPLAKVNRIRMRFDPAIKKAIKLCSQLGGKGIVNLTDVDISITWQDGLPGDPTEEANIINLRTGGKQTMSTQRVLTQYDAMSTDDAEAEMERIQEEEAMSAPTPLPSFAQTDNATAPTQAG